MNALGCISNTLETSPLFIRYTMRMLENVYPQVEIDKHDCSILAYVDDEQRYLCEDSMKKNEKLSKEDDEEIQ